MRVGSGSELEWVSGSEGEGVRVGSGSEGVRVSECK